MTTRHQRNLSKRQAQAVTKIQAVFRGYQCRLDLEEKHVAATRIQTQFRGYLTRSKIQSQTVYRSKNSRINAQLLQTQQKINALEKEMQSLSLASRTRVWESERRDRAARIIQKHVRGHLLRRSFMSRPVSPTKSIHERVAEEEDARVKVRDLLKLSNDTDDVDLVRHTVSSIHRRVLNDQFRHDRLYASLGKIHHEDDQIGPVLDQLETTAAQTTNLVAKLKTLGGLLDDYYSPVQNPGLAGVSMRSDGLLRECIQLRQETDSYLDTMNAVFSNGSCDLESLVSQIKLPSRLKTLVKREHADAVKHSTSNWWDLVPVYCDETLSNEAALDSILETTGVTQEMTEISMEPRAF